MSIFTKYKNNQVTFKLMINGKVVKGISLKRIKKMSEQKDLLINRTAIFDNEAFFKVNNKGFQSFFIPFEVDLVFVDKNNRVILINSNFKPNSISDYQKDCKYLYIFKSNFVEKKSIQLKDSITREILR